MRANPLICAPWALAACITTAVAEGRTPVRSLLEIREDRVIVQKWETSCAAAALATVLIFSHNDTVTEKAVTMGMLRTTDPIRVKVRGGFSMLDMKHFVETRGFNGVGYKNLSFEDLLALHAPIVPINFKATRTLSLCVASTAMVKFTSLILRSESHTPDFRVITALPIRF